MEAELFAWQNSLHGSIENNMSQKLQTLTGNGLDKAVLVGLVYQEQTVEQLEEYLDELAFLATTAGAKTLKTFYQNVDHPDPRTYVRKGKLMEIKKYVNDHDVNLVIFDDEISPSQQRNIQEELKVRVLDRSMLILEIFASRAQTVQARTQVELARLQYMLPRLKGMWTHLERQRGGTGTRGGAGEKEIETDRRMAQKRITQLKQKLEQIDKQNMTRRKQRGKMIRVALVGYTNVGKSTLMNQLSKSEVFAENKLFATLDTTVRKAVVGYTPFLLSDTVGFIRKLPHHLVESFKSTLDEAVESDILLHVVDISHPQFEDQIKVVNETLKELHALDKPTLMVFNKMDRYEQKAFDPYLKDEVKQELLEEMKESWRSRTQGEAVFISALHKDQMTELRDKLEKLVTDLYKERYPYETDYFGLQV